MKATNSRTEPGPNTCMYNYIATIMLEYPYITSIPNPARTILPKPETNDSDKAPRAKGAARAPRVKAAGKAPAGKRPK